MSKCARAVALCLSRSIPQHNRTRQVARNAATLLGAPRRRIERLRGYALADR